MTTLPNPSEMRYATDEERLRIGASVIVEDFPERRLDHSALIDIYRRLHRWAHEFNPYTALNYDEFLRKNYKSLIDDVVALSKFISNHAILIERKGFFCVLRDADDGLTKVLTLGGQVVA